MSDDAGQRTTVSVNDHRPNRWWLDIHWITAGVVVGTIAFLLWGLFGPEPAIRVSRETTYLTEPLAADGLPDYCEALLAMAGPAPPPEENAAAALLQVCWPMGIDDADLPAVCAALGIPNDPPSDSLRSPYEDAASGVTRDMFDAAIESPWSGADLPELETWLVKNEAQIDGLARSWNRADSIQLERLGGIDATIFIAARSRIARAEHFQDMGNRQIELLLATSLDWNDILQRVNKDYDDAEAALHLPTLASQRASLKSREDALLAEVNAGKTASSVLPLMCNRAVRSGVIARHISGLFSPTSMLSACLTTEARSRARFLLARTAVALTAWRADHPGDGLPYPERLDDLVSRYLLEVPIDPFSGKSLIYERREDGYLLASVGENGVYDGGSDMAGWIIDGEWQEVERDVPRDASDLVIRMPVPERPFVLPAAP